MPQAQSIFTVALLIAAGTVIGNEWCATGSSFKDDPFAAGQEEEVCWSSDFRS